MTITHPFHPLCGRKFEILTTREYQGQDIFSLKSDQQGAFGIPREWTDRADPCPYNDLDIPPPLFALHALIELVEMVKQKKH